MIYNTKILEDWNVILIWNFSPSLEIDTNANAYLLLTKLAIIK